MLNCQLGYVRALREEQRGRWAKKSAYTFLPHERECLVETLNRGRRHGDELDPEGSASRLYRLQCRLVGGRGGSPKDADAHRVRHCFLQYFQLFDRQLGEKARQSRDVSPWPRETRDVPDTDGIGMDREHDWDRFGRFEMFAERVYRFNRAVRPFSFNYPFITIV
jgi:hypothetical protein